MNKKTWRRQLWTPAEEEYLRSRYSDSPTKEIAKQLGRTVAKVYAKADRLGLAKSKEYLAHHCRLQKGSTLGEAYRFVKGQTPPNKGLRRPGWSAGRMQESQFKKGQRTGIAATNWKPVGTILADTEGYLRIKVRESVAGTEATGFGNVKVWPLYHRRLWEQANGPIPAGHVLVFKDGDRSHCQMENLELITRAELAERNSMWNNYPPELAHAIQLNGALKRHLGRQLNEGVAYDAE